MHTNQALIYVFTRKWLTILAAIKYLCRYTNVNLEIFVSFFFVKSAKFTKIKPS